MASHTASGTTGLRYVGRTSSGGFTVVDVDDKSFEKLPSAMPRMTTCDGVVPREGWLAIDGGSSLWAVSPRFDADPEHIVSTFLNVPCRDGVTMWVSPTGGEHEGRILAVDGERTIRAELRMPEGWTTLVADLPGCIVVSRRSSVGRGSELAALDDEGALRNVAPNAVVVAVRGRHVAWAVPDPRHEESTVLGRAAIADLTSGATVEVDLPAIIEWHRKGSFSPDGASFAIGGYLDPNPVWGMTPRPSLAEFLRSAEEGKSKPRRRSVMVVIDAATGAARVSDGTYEDFASAPLWSSDSRTVLFHPPFEDRRLYVVDVATMSMRAVAFRRSALEPLLLWNDDLPVEPANAAAIPAAVIEDPRFATALADAGLGRFASQILGLDRMSCRLHVTGRSGEAEVVGGSRLGGRPDLSDDVEWPAWNGAPLAFVAQVALGALPPLPDSPLPADGLLSLFYDAVEMPAGYDPAHRGGWRLIHQPAEAALSLREFPEGLPDEARFDSVPLTGVPELTHVPWESADFDTVAVSPDQGYAYADLIERREGLCHRLLGHPDAIQGDMQMKCQLVSHGVTRRSSGEDDPRIAELRKGATDWQLVLQIDSDDEAGMNWVEHGRLYVFMTGDALAHRRWDEAWLVCQFT